VKRCSSRTGSN